MTFCKLLAEAKAGNQTVSAWEMWDKGSSVPRYEVSVSNPDGLSFCSVKAARTTWRRKWSELFDKLASAQT